MNWKECIHIQIFFTEDPEPDTKGYMEFKLVKGSDEPVKYSLEPSIIVIKSVGDGTYIFPYRIIGQIAIYSDDD
jgi:hypothetical protein